MLILRCHIQYPSSFGIISHFLMREVIKRDLDHKLYMISNDPGPFPPEEYDFLMENRVTEHTLSKLVDDTDVLSITTNPLLRPSPKREILYTDYEADRIPSFFRDSLNRVSEIIVPSQFAKESLIKGGVDRSISVVPHGILPGLFTPTPSDRLPDRFTFVTVAADDWRKGLDTLAQAYTKEFTPREAILRVHSSADIRGMGIHQCKTRVPFSRMGDIYKGNSCFVLPTRGEGFCLPALEALASGLPVIITNVGGQVEFLKDDYYPVETKGYAYRPGADKEFQTIRYVEPDVGSLREQMRYVYDNYEEARRKAIRGSLRVKQTYTWSRTLDMIEEIVNA